MPLIAALLGGGIGAIASGISAQLEANNLRDTTRKYNRQLENTANRMIGANANESAARSQAYREAAAMMRRFKENPQAASAISQGLQTSLRDSLSREQQNRAAATNILAQRHAVPSANNAWLSGAMKGAMSGAGAGVSLFSTLVSSGWKPEKKKIKNTNGYGKTSLNSPGATIYDPNKGSI